MISIKARIILSYTIVFGLMLSGFAILIYKTSRDAEASKIDTRLESHADKLQTEIEEQLDEHRFPNAQDFGDFATEGLYLVHTQIYDKTGHIVLSDTLLEKESIPAIELLQEGRREIRYRWIGAQQYRELLLPMEIEDWGTRFLLQIAVPTVAIDEGVRHLQVLFAIAIPAALLFAAIAAYLITRAAFKPVTSMVETVRTISANNLDSRVQLSKVHDEIHLLGETFNGMIQRIHDAFEGQRQFIADASHELRTPLTVICSELEFIQQRTTDEKVKESSRTSLAEIDRLARMTKGMLLLSTMDDSQSRLSLETIRLDEVIVECVQLLKTIAAEKSIDLQIRIDEVVEIQADRDKIKSAILNLVDNAMKYSEQGGSVTISLTVPQSDPPMARVVIQDGGAGIPPTDLQHVFKRFYRSATSRADHGGSGLGLSIVEQVAKLHRGKISLQSELQKGTTAVLDLPLSHPAQENL